MENNKSEFSKLLDDLAPSQDTFKDIVESPKKEVEEPKKEENEEEIVPLKNRTHRRKETALAQLNEEIARQEAYLRGLQDAPQGRSEKDFSELPKEWIALYGDTPEAKKAWEINASLLQQAEERAADRAYARFQEEQDKTAQEQARYESEIDSNLENLEELSGIDLTSNAPAAKRARTEFLDLVERLSPKDDEGNLTGYADFGSTFEIYQKTKQKPDASRQKELASRSMTNSTSTAPVREDTSAMRKFLSENGIRT